MTDPTRSTPLAPAHVALKARMVPFAGYLMPVLYKGVVEEHRAVRRGAGLFDISHMARVDLTGPYALPLLEWTFANAVTPMRQGQVRYGCVCSEAGGVLDDVLVTRWGAEDFAVVVNASNRDKILAHWAGFRDRFPAEVRDETDGTAMVAVQGPDAARLVASLLPGVSEAMKYYTAVRTSFAGHPATLSRTGYTGEDGFELTVPAAAGVHLWDTLAALGAAPCGLGARDTLRLEAGMPLYGHELNEETTPIEAGLGWATKLAKPFSGRDGIQNRPVTKTRVGLELAGKRAAREGSPILLGGEPVGVVTSGSYAPGLEKSIAMGYVPPGRAAIGTALEIDIRGTPTPATVVALPFYARAR